MAVLGCFQSDEESRRLVYAVKKGNYPGMRTRI